MILSTPIGSSTRPHAFAMTGWSSTTRMPLKVFSPVVVDLTACPGEHEVSRPAFVSRLSRWGKMPLSRLAFGNFPDGSGLFASGRSLSVQYYRDSELAGDKEAGTEWGETDGCSLIASRVGLGKC